MPNPKLSGVMSTALTQIAMRRPWCVVRIKTARALISKGYVRQVTLAIAPLDGIAVELTAFGREWVAQRT